MNPREVFVINEGQLNPALIETIKKSANDSDDGLYLCESLAKGIERLKELSNINQPPKVILLGANLSSPIAAARQAHQIAPQAQLIFLTNENERSQIQNDLRFTTIPGSNWTLASSTNPNALQKTIENALKVASQQRQLRTTLDKINLKLSEPPPDSSTIRKLLISDRYLASLLNQAQDAIISTDLQGRIISWNRAAENLFGYNEQEIIGEEIEKLVAKREREFLPEWIEALKSGSSDARREMTAKRRDGTTFDIELSIALIKDETGSQQLGMAIIAHDISDRKQKEQQLSDLLQREQNARRSAEEASRIKDEFLATVSHELRTPLNAILGWSKLLSAGTLDEKAAARALVTVERNARSQAQLIDDLLDISRIITGKLRLEIYPLDLSRVIEAAIEAVRPAADAKGIRLQVLLDTEAGAISGDSNRLQQVFWNLLTNAVKFTPKGGRVQVRLERINSHVEIVVSDTGQGIAPEFLPHIFDRFRQADQTTTRRYGGLGLGLSIVRQLVEMHGGTVHAESEGEGKGASFVVKLPRLITIPRRESPAEERVHPTRSDDSVSIDCLPGLEGLQVLVVDDEADSRELLRAVLEQCGSKVTTADSAAEALAFFEADIPDLLISDIGMPGEDGYTLIRKVRSLPKEKGGRIPAIALTAYARVEDRIRALNAGFQVHIPKPVEPVELAAVVASLAKSIGKI
jgi:PAS domain S-box-containing protein